MIGRQAALIAQCRRRRIRLITVGGAGGQIDPTRVRVADLSRTEHDALLVKEVGSTTSASSSAIGAVNYTEEYEIVLQTLDPMG